MEQEKAPPPVPPRRGIAAVMGAFWNTLGGIQEGLRTERAIKQEFVVAAIVLPLSFFVARDLWTWVALIASLLFVLSTEFLNTAIERLSDHLHPEKHEAIRITKDFASAGVFFAITLCALVWLAALWMRFAA